MCAVARNHCRRRKQIDFVVQSGVDGGDGAVSEQDARLEECEVERSASTRRVVEQQQHP
jgi:hypothetical protein